MVYIRGAYFAGSSSEKKPIIDVFILDPNRKVIFSRRRMQEGIFRFNATVPGTYSFIFSNLKVNITKNIWLILFRVTKRKILL